LHRLALRADLVLATATDEAPLKGADHALLLLTVLDGLAHLIKLYALGLGRFHTFQKWNEAGVGEDERKTRIMTDIVTDIPLRHYAIRQISLALLQPHLSRLICLVHLVHLLQWRQRAILRCHHQ